MQNTLRRIAVGVLMAPVVLAAAGCGDMPTDRTPLAPDLPQEAAAAMAAAAMPPRLVSRTPQYPAVAVYIIYREYVNQHPGLTRLDTDNADYQRYVERRLRELYPQRGYAGMMREAVAEMREYRRQWHEYEKARRGRGGITPQSCEINMTSISPAEYCEPGGGGGGGGGSYPPPPPEYYDDGSWSGQSEFLVDETIVPTVVEEVDSLQASSAEHQQLLYYESLALGDDGGYELQSADGTLTRDDLIRMAAANPGVPGEFSAQLWGPTVNIPLGIIGFFAVRILFSKWRAESASASYYPSLNPGDTKRDAFRHIYVNVMLRRYITAPLAKAVMDANEWGNAHWGPRIMDVHNNRLGVEVKYEHFRGHWFWDRWSYGVWGGRVRTYVNDSRNAAYLPALATAYTESEAKAIRNTVPSYIYIYFAQ